MNKKKQKRPALPAHTSSGPSNLSGPLSACLVRRPLWLTIVLFQLLGVLLWLSNALSSGIDNSLVLPIRIGLLGLGSFPGPNQPLERLELDLPAKLTVQRPEGNAVIDPLQAQNGVEVAIGDKKFTFTRDEFFKRWQISQAKNPSNEALTYHIVAPEEVSADHSLLPMFRSRINWGGDWNLLYYAFPKNIFILLETGMVVMLLLRSAGASRR